MLENGLLMLPSNLSGLIEYWETKADSLPMMDTAQTEAMVCREHETVEENNHEHLQE